MEDKEQQRPASESSENAGDAQNAGGKKKGRRKKASFGFGLGNMFGMPFMSNPAQLMQMLPFMMAMGGSGLPKMGMAAFSLQIKMTMWMVETWIDYLNSVQEVFMRSLTRLKEIETGWSSSDDADDEDDDEEEDAQSW